MAKGKLILICQSGGQFVTTEDGTLSYDGGDANAVNITHETLYDDLKLKVAEMYNLDQKTISMKYFLPGNRRTLITLRNVKDLKRMLDYHGSSVTADIFVTGNEGFDCESLKVQSTRGISVNVAETVEPILSPPAANSIGPNMKKSTDKKAVPSKVTVPVITPDNLVDVNVTMESPSRTTSDSIPSATNADDDSDYAPRHTVTPVATTSSPTSLDTGATPADTVKKRRRTASWKIGATGPIIVVDADSDNEKRSKKKKKSRVVPPECDDLEPTGDHNPSTDGIGRPCAIATHNQEFPEKLVASWRGGITGVGQDFKSVKEFQDTLQKYAISHCFVYKFKKNDTIRAIGTCVSDGCPWNIHAAWISASQSFRIKKFYNIHTCGGEAWKSAHPGRNWLVNIIKDRLQESPIRKPREIANCILQEFGIELNHTQLMRGFEHAREQLEGSYKYSYKQLPAFCEKVVETNPGSFAKLVIDDKKRFKCLFVSFHCLIHGFLNGCRPLLFLESTSLKSDYQEILLTATAVDADDGFLPIAFAIVDVENNESWRWFLEQIKSAIATPGSITFVSDRDKGLKNCVLEVFENAFHGYSMFHLVESFRRSLKGPLHDNARGLLPKVFLSAAHAVRLSGFQKFSEQIKQASSQAYDWVIQIEPECWTRLLFKGEPYNYIIEDVAELYKKLLEDEQESTIVQKIEALVSMISGLIKTRQAESSLWTSKLTPSIEKRLKEDADRARGFRVLFSSDTVAEVHDDCSHVVNIVNQDCTCLEWKENGLPCRHAIRVLNSKSKSPYDYCPKHFTVETYRSIYSESLHPIPDNGKPGMQEMADSDTREVPPVQTEQADSGTGQVPIVQKEKADSGTGEVVPIQQETADSESVHENADSYPVEVVPIQQETADSESVHENADSYPVEVLPPNNPLLTTELKKEQAKTDALNKRTVTCRRCKEPGHNKASCTAIL